MDRSTLKARLINQITCDLTVSREDYKENAYTQEQIDEFVNKNDAKIEKAINYILEDYDEEEGAPENDLIREALYEFVDTFLGELAENDDENDE